MYVQRIHARGISGLCSRSHSNKNRRDKSCLSTSIAIIAYSSPIVSWFFWDKQNITESDFPPSPVILSRQYCETQLPSTQKSLPTPRVRPGPACFVASETIWSSGGIQHPGVCCLDSAGVFKVCNPIPLPSMFTQRVMFWGNTASLCANAFPVCISKIARIYFQKSNHCRLDRSCVNLLHRFFMIVPVLSANVASGLNCLPNVFHVNSTIHTRQWWVCLKVLFPLHPNISQWNMPIQVYTFYFALTRLASMKLLFQSLLIPCPKPLLFFFCLLRIRRADHRGAQWLDELRTNGKTVYIFCTWMMCVLPLPPWVQDLQGMCTDQWILILKWCQPLLQFL